MEGRPPIAVSLVDACEKGNLELLKECLCECKKQEVNPFQAGKSPSLFNVVSGSPNCPLEVLEELITTYRNWSLKSRGKGSGLVAYLRDSLTPEGYTALHCACKSNKLDFVYVFVKELRFYGTVVNTAVEVCTPFDVACRCGCHRIALFLLQKCKDIYEDFSRGLIIAYQLKHTQLIVCVCKVHKVTVKVLNSLCKKKRYDIVDFCIKNKLCKQEGKQLLLMAASKGEVDLLDHLLQPAGEDNFDMSKYVDRSGINLFHAACSEHRLACVEYLLKRKNFMIMAVSKNRKGNRPISIAMNYDFHDIFETLTRQLRLNPLHLFFLYLERTLIAKNDQKTILRKLLDESSSPFEQDSCGNTPLHYAFENVKLDCVDTFLEKPSLNLAVQNANGDTPVHLLSQQLCKVNRKVESFEASEKASGELRWRKTLDHLQRDQIISYLTKVMKHSTFDPCIRNAKKETVLFALLVKLNLSNSVIQTVLNLLLPIVVKAYDDPSILNQDVVKIVHHYCRYCYKEIPKKQLRGEHQHPFITFISKLMASQNFNPNATDSNGDTCLHFASACLWVELVRHLLTYPNTSVHVTNVQGKNPFRNVPDKISKLTNICKIYAMLIDRGVHVDFSDDDKGNTFLHIACIAKSASLLETLAKLSDIKRVLNHPNKDGKIPLHLLCSHAKQYVSVECFEVLLRFAKIDVNISTRSGKTPLDILISAFNVNKKPIMYERTKQSIILFSEHPSFLLECYTAPKYLKIWCQVGRADIVAKIISKDSSLVNTLNDFDQNLLHIACLNFNSEVVDFLLSLADTIDSASELTLAYDYFARTPFHSLCWRAWVSEVKIDEESAVNILISLTKLDSVKDIVNEVIDGRAAIHLLCSSRNFLVLNDKLFEQLLKIPTIDPNVKDFTSNTPLHLAYKERDQLKIDLLLDHPGIDTNITNDYGQTPLSCSIYNELVVNVDDILANSGQTISSYEVRSLLSIGVNAESFRKLFDFCDSNDGNTTLHIACELMKKDAVSILLSEADVSVGCTNSRQETPIHTALAKMGLSGMFRSFDFDDFLQVFHLLRKHASYSSDIMCVQNSDGNNCLHLACMILIPPPVQEIISEQVDVTVKNKKGNTPLHIACNHSQVYAVTYLLQQEGINVGEVNAKQETAFHIVAGCRCGESIACKMLGLLKRHSSFNDDILRMLDNNGNTCLHKASFVFTRKHQVMSDICTIPDLINIQNSEGQTALHLFSGLLFNDIMSPNLAAQDRSGNNPVWIFLLALDNKSRNEYNCLNKDSSCIEMWKHVVAIESFESCINQVNDDGRTILHLACTCFNSDLVLKEEIVDTILSFPSCDPNIVDKERKTPIHILAKHKYYSKLQFDKLCRKHSKIDLSVRDSKGDTPLHILLSFSWDFDKLHIFDQLVTDEPELPLECIKESAYGVSDISICNKDGNTALHKACSYSYLYYIKILSHAMSDVNLQNKDGKTPLHCFQTGRDAQIFSKSWKILTSHQSFNPNIQDNEGVTVLHRECKSYKPDLCLVRFLLTHKDSNITLTNSKNHTCFDLALANYICKESSSLVDLVSKYFHEKTKKDDLSSFALFLSPNHGIYVYSHYHNDCCRVLKSHSSVTPLSPMEDHYDNTALHLACQVVCPTAIRKFLQKRSCRKKISTFPINKLGQTPLHMLALGIKQEIDFLTTTYSSLRDFVQTDVSVARKKLTALGKYDWQILLQCGVNKQDETGNTALHYACEAQSVLMLKALASNRSCNFEIRNNAEELPITIAQKSGNRSFFLRVLIKYFERQDNQNLVEYYKTVLKDGAIPMRPVKCILTGPPAAGKTTLKQRLLGESDPSGTSTGVADSPQVVAVREISQENVSISSADMKWTPVDCRDQVEALLQTLSLNIHDAIEKRLAPAVGGRRKYEESSFKTQSSSVDLLKPETCLQFEVGGCVSSSTSSKEKHFKSNYDVWSQKEMKARDKEAKKQYKSLEQQVRELRKLVNSVPAKKSKSDPQKFRVGDLKINPFVRIVDTGGQPELHELLPVFITGPAINLIVFNLMWPLQEHYPIYYRAAQNIHSLTYESSLNHEDMILRSLSSIACLGHGQKLQSTDDDDEPVDPVAFLIGSHKDKVSEEDIETINKHLKCLIEMGELFHKDIVKYCSTDSIIYAVNSLDENCEEIDDLRKSIFQRSRDFEPIDIPISWLILSIKLQVLIEKKSVKSVIDIDECLEIAQTCGIPSIDHLKKVLWFFHNAMGIVMYFSHIPELESKVILDLQAIFNCITQLVTSCFLFESIGSKSAEEDFSKRGYFTKKSLRKVLKKNPDIPFSAEEIIALMCHLYVIVAIGNDVFFMPTALKPEILPDPVTSSSLPPPLLVSFECGYSPVGVFTSLVAHLLSDTNDKCSLADTPHYRNKIKVYVDLRHTRCHLTIIARASYFEIWLDVKYPEVIPSVAEVSKEILTIIDRGITAVTQSLHYKYSSKHFFGFVCTDEECQSYPVHPTICQSFESNKLKCVQSRKLISLSADQLVWYGVQEEVFLTPGSLMTGISAEVLQKILGIDDMGDVLESLSDLVDWKCLGLNLGLKYPTLERIERDKKSTSDCIIAMLACWLKKQDNVESKNGPSWKQLITALQKVKEITVAESIAKELKGK